MEKEMKLAMFAFFIVGFVAVLFSVSTDLSLTGFSVFDGGQFVVGDVLQGEAEFMLANGTFISEDEKILMGLSSENISLSTTFNFSDFYSGELIDYCLDENVSENCSEISRGFYISKDEKFVFDLAELNYTFISAGNYTLFVELEKTDLEIEEDFVVGELVETGSESLPEVSASSSENFSEEDLSEKQNSFSVATGNFVVEDFSTYGSLSAGENLSSNFNLTSNVLIVYNANSNDSLEIAEYYADVRGINHNRLCEVHLPTGQYATWDELLGARKEIIENCVCDFVSITGCSTSNVSLIANSSNITHMVIIKGIPPRLYRAPFDDDGEEPSFDYFLAGLVYQVAEDYGFLGSRSYSVSAYSPISGYLRVLNMSVDKQMAYGRIEAMDVNRTKLLIDRTLEAEQKGISGNFIDGYGTSSLFATLADGNDSYQADGNYSGRRVWIGEGDIPGESGSNIDKVYNAGVFFNDYYEGNWMSAFDGFYNMINWRKNSTDCEPLCNNTADVEACRASSTDYFKTINTDCVGVADGFLGFQLRSWPVQYYGSWPDGWGVYYTDNGRWEKTAPIVMNGSSFTNAKFTDTKYLRIGSPNQVANPVCNFTNGTQENCSEFVFVNLATTPDVTNFASSSSETYTYRMRIKNSASANGKVYYAITGYYTDGTSTTHKSGSVSLNSARTDWETVESTFSITGGKTFDKFSLRIYGTPSIVGASWVDVRGWIELDGIEIVNSTGFDFIPKEYGSFNFSDHDQVTGGDWAFNVIDRLGGIGWWGSSSHYNTGGFAFWQSYESLGAVYSGKSLGEGLMYAGKTSGVSGIIYGDPLYRPSGVKIYLGNGGVFLNSYSQGYRFSNTGSDEVINLSLNAFHGLNNLENSTWKLSSCYWVNVSLCNSENNWTEFDNGTGALFEKNYSINLTSFLENTSVNDNFTIKLSVYNEGDEEDILSNVAYFYYGSCIDSDGDGYGSYCELGSDCNDSSSSVWRLGNFYVDSDGDSYGVDGLQEVCYGTSTPTGYSTIAGDCNDSSALSWLNYEKVYTDTDSDNFGAGSVVENYCGNSTLILLAEIAGDCDDASASNKPYATEVCDYLSGSNSLKSYYDNDCDSSTTELAACCGTNGVCDSLIGETNANCPSDCPASSARSSSGGGGGGGSATKVNTSANQTIIKDVTESVEFDEDAKEMIYNFSFNNENHTLRVLNFTNESAWIEIRSEPLIVEVFKDEFTSVDLDSDGENDIELAYDGIVEGKIKLEVRMIVKKPNEVYFLFGVIGGLGLIILVLLFLLWRKYFGAIYIGRK